MSPASFSPYGVGQEGRRGAREDKRRGQGKKEDNKRNTLVTYTAFWISST